MDDQTFDQKNALEWINIIEDEKARSRESDIYPKLKALVSQIGISEVLEIGCGQGICSDYLELTTCTYTGIEPSSFLLDRAKQLYGSDNRKFVIGNAYHIPFSDETFDAAFSVSVWHLLSNLKQAATELNRVLKTEGQFLIITANPDAYSLWISAYTETEMDGRRFEGKSPNNLRDVLYLHTLDEIVTSLESAHLKVQSSETFRPSVDGQKMFVAIKGKKWAENARLNL